VEKPMNAINQEWRKSNKNKDKKKLESAVIDSFVQMRKTPVLPIDNENRDAQLFYNRSLCNAAVSIAQCIGVIPKQFVFLFAKDSSYNSYIWDCVIDKYEKIHLPLELHKPLVKIRLNDLREKSGYSAEKEERNIAYMNSVALTGSR
jgi:hypothetical protein